jgi:hypothetical protein
MLLLKYLLMIAGIGLFGSAAAFVTYDIYLAAQLRRLLSRGETGPGQAADAQARRPLRAALGA